MLCYHDAVATSRREEQPTKKHEAPAFGPVPQLRILRAHDDTLIGLVSAPVALFAGDVILVGRREPQFYPAIESPPETLVSLGLASVSRQQLELRFAYGCFHLEPIGSAKQKMQVRITESGKLAPLDSRLVVEPGAVLLLGTSIEILLTLSAGSTSVIDEARERNNSKPDQVVGRILGVQPAAVGRMFGIAWCKTRVHETRFLRNDARYRALRGAAVEVLTERLRSERFDLQAAATHFQVPRTTLVRLMDSLSIPRAATLDAAAIRETIKRCAGNIDRAAEALEVSGQALRRRLRKGKPE